jgi:hypothetical protein
MSKQQRYNRGGRNGQPAKRGKQPLRSSQAKPANPQQNNDHPISRRTAEIIRFMRAGEVPADLPFPETMSRFITGAYSSATLVSTPQNIPRGATRSRKRDIRVTIGTAGVGWLIVQPNWAVFNDCDTVYSTASTYTGTTFPTAAATGLNAAPFDSASPYNTNFNYIAWTACCTVKMKANAAALLNKSGRMLMGLNYTEVQGADTFATLEQLQTFQSWGVDQNSAKAMPMVSWIPMNHASQPSAPTTPTTTFPGIIIGLEGLPAASVLDFTLEYSAVVAGVHAPWDRKLCIDTDAIMAAHSSMLITAKKGFSHTQQQEPKVQVSHGKEAAHQEVKKQPLISRIVNLGKEFISDTPVGRVIRGAYGFAKNLLSKIPL